MVESLSVLSKRSRIPILQISDFGEMPSASFKKTHLNVVYNEKYRGRKVVMVRYYSGMFVVYFKICVGVHNLAESPAIAIVPN